MKLKIGITIQPTLSAKLFCDRDRQRLEALGHVVWNPSSGPLAPGDAIKFLADCDIGVGSWGTPGPNAAIVAGCPKLRLWEHVAGSVKHFFGPHLEGRNLQIASCAPAIAVNVAEMAVGEIIYGLRRIAENSAANRGALAVPPPNAMALGTATVGVIGASHVGRNVVRMLQPFRPRILLFDPFVSEAQAVELGAIKAPDLRELCRKSHAVTLHTPDLPATKKIVGRAEFQAMRDDCVFVNTSRGACIDEEALIGELERGRLLAFLDVTEPEPPALESPLRRLPNCVYTSHYAGCADPNLGAQAVDDIAAFIAGGKPKMVVTREMLDRLA
jgi:phosphoglycerate dehydrogenase-like enzyme